jgi:hypothetical protein
MLVNGVIGGMKSNSHHENVFGMDASLMLAQEEESSVLNYAFYI